MVIALGICWKIFWSTIKNWIQSFGPRLTGPSQLSPACLILIQADSDLSKYMIVFCLYVTIIANNKFPNFPDFAFWWLPLPYECQDEYQDSDDDGGGEDEEEQQELIVDNSGNNDSLYKPNHEDGEGTLLLPEYSQQHLHECPSQICSPRE